MSFNALVIKLKLYNKIIIYIIINYIYIVIKLSQYSYNLQSKSYDQIIFTSSNYVLTEFYVEDLNRLKYQLHCTAPSKGRL